MGLVGISARVTLRLTVFLSALSVAAMLAYGFGVEPYRVEVRHLLITDRKLAKVFGDQAVVQVSDLHSEHIGRREKLVLSVIDRVKPALVLLTGDYLGWRGEYETAVAFLRLIKGGSEVFAVMGDYDYSFRRKSCLFCHEPGERETRPLGSVKFLRNSFVRLHLRNGPVWVGGYDPEGDPDFLAKRNEELSKMGEPVIVLSHSPLAFDDITDDVDMLMLAGDTHGGQVPLPSWLWKHLGYVKTAKYSQGFFQSGRKKMFVSKGVGTSHIPFRFLRQPEVVVFHFRAP
jgi:hypothetical protein